MFRSFEVKASIFSGLKESKSKEFMPHNVDCINKQISCTRDILQTFKTRINSSFGTEQYKVISVQLRNRRVNGPSGYNATRHGMYRPPLWYNLLNVA